MQITIQMLDGSITPFKARSSITIASLKAKFEPWQPMKGRALLHHDVQLDDRAILGSVPGVKDGTILRVDEQVSQVKDKATGKKRLMSGPARSAVDEDVVESIEQSGGDDEETPSEDEKRISSSKRRRPLRTPAGTVEDFIDDGNIANSPQGKALVLDDMSDDTVRTADTNLSDRAKALHIAKKEKGKNTAREPTDMLASKAQNIGHRLHALNTFAPPPENPVQNPTASAHMPKTTEAISSRQDVMEDDDATFLAGINAAAAATQRLPLHCEAGPEEDVSVHRCDACGRACRCGGDRSATSNSVVPVEETNRGREAASTNSNLHAHLIARRNPASQHAESSWTGM
ncbi:hypothetical protein HO133_010733 [Letharia lupina]|uniref:Ubiquitin-like domain-containing protein n=1 Tax=Letharia lupina TaxID=560253 RepID=A0A8H6CIL2_9LECA|nr:uncharacterized protein HO133_010733 [Letharia lupina]KAF6224159.1 hypothetical protein HO133_010733 [Letharia lupina]